MNTPQKNIGQLEYNFFKPFGPTIARYKLPDVIFDILSNLTDEILSHENRVSMGANLAGQIAEEPAIPTQSLRETGLEQVFEQCVRHYVKQFYDAHNNQDGEYDIIDAEIKSCWVVSQYENEYNPAHYHPGCTISAVLYLKLPDKTPRNIPGKLDLDGCIQWLNHSNVPGTLDAGTYTCTPEVGSLYMFPSHLLHTVYPFQGSGERRSVSFNASHNLREISEPSRPDNQGDIISG